MNKRYFWSTLLLSLIGLPLLCQVSTIAVLSGQFAAVIANAVILLVILILVWNGRAKSPHLPDSAFQRYLPLGIACGYYLLAFILAMGISGYRFDSDTFQKILIWPTFPWLVFHFFLGFLGDYSLFPVLVAAIYGLSLLIFAVCCRIQKRPSTGWRKGAALLGALLCLGGVSAWQFQDKSTQILSSDYSVLRVQDEVNLFDYEPFREGNLLAVPSQPVSLVIDSDYPRLDGATAAFPVYAAMVQAAYQGLNEESVNQYVSCTKTAEAYERLIRGDIDIFFGAQPSRQQMEAAAQVGVNFHLTPIAKEAFVFFVNSTNPVSSLTVEQIQDIYQKKITNWNRVGGSNERILPFQRPENSGSQTIMQQVMGDKSLPEPLEEERVAGMGGIIVGVATYRNYTGAIGYSFRYFATGMRSDEGIKFLAVEGVPPSTENIRNGAYPFTVDVYAVTTKEPEGNTKHLMDWILSPEGQALIEQCGYVGIGS